MNESGSRTQPFLAKERLSSLLASTRVVPAGIVAASLVAGGIILFHQARAVAELKQHVQEENRLGMRSTREHIEDYFDSVYSTLLFVSLDDDVRAMRTDSREFIQHLYDHQWDHHRLSEVYVVERDFAGTRRPFQTFERGSEQQTVDDLHSLWRERDEYQTQMGHIRQFLADTNLPALISPEIPLCVNDPGGKRARGVVYSVPIHWTTGLSGITAGMIPTHILGEVLERDQPQQVALLINSRGETYGGRPADEPLRAGLSARFAQGGVARFFAEQAPSFEVSRHIALWCPVKIVSAERWWLVYLYDRDTQLRRSVFAGGFNHGALAGASVLAGLALALLARTTAKRLADQLSRLRERQQLERQVQAASEREQQRIGDNLRQDLCQRLAGIEAMTSALRKQLAAKTAPKSELVTMIADELHGSLGCAQQLANELQPVSFLKEGLLAAIQELALNTEKRSGVPCRFERDHFPDVSDAGLATHLYRIAQEALANAVQHAKAKQIHIELSADSREMTLAVGDDGVGLPAEAGRGPGMGLRIMRYRSDLIGGQLEIQSPPHGGTVVTCRLPLAALNKDSSEPGDPG